MTTYNKSGNNEGAGTINPEFKSAHADTRRPKRSILERERPAATNVDADGDIGYFPIHKSDLGF